MSKRVRLERPEVLYTAHELAEKLDVALITVYMWRRWYKLPWKRPLPGDPTGQQFRFAHSELTEWLRERRPELMPHWNGEDAPITKAHAWTRKRLQASLGAQVQHDLSRTLKAGRRR